LLSFYNRGFAGRLVRALVLSDIHGNLEALDACLAAAPAHDLVVNLGDIVGYGGSPNEVIERSRSLGKFFVRGNHDRAVTDLTDLKDFNPIAAAAALWTRSQLTPENLEWLNSLPHGPIEIEDLAGVQFAHGSPQNEDDYVVTLDDALQPMAAGARVTFIGHTHLQGCFWTDGVHADSYRPPYKTVGQSETADFALEKDARYLVNPGSVGQPRDGDWRAAFALFDSEKSVVTFCRVPYNLKQAQDRILAANLPERLATRLAAGR
jgi:diadenosine tetraphosphatase ApaH/serine/threonine PP2A family protein phosphatase